MFSRYLAKTQSDQMLKNMFRKWVLLLHWLIHMQGRRKIWDLAYTDITTGLPNRHSFVNTIEREVQQGQSGFIKILKPSEFHQVVELYGREIGDELLRQLAKRLEQDKSESNEYVARFTSSSLIMTTMSLHEDLNDYEMRIKETIRQPFIIGGKQIYITLKQVLLPIMMT